MMIEIQGSKYQVKTKRNQYKNNYSEPYIVPVPT